MTDGDGMWKIGKYLLLAFVAIAAAVLGLSFYSHYQRQATLQTLSRDYFGEDENYTVELAGHSFLLSRWHYVNRNRGNAAFNIIVTWPDMQPALLHERDGRPYDGKEQIGVLVQYAPQYVPLEEHAEKVWNFNSSGQVLAQQDAASFPGFRHVAMRNFGRTADLYTNVAERVFIECDRREGWIINPHCSHFFYYGSLIVSASYRVRLLGEQAEIQKSLTETLRQMEEQAHVREPNRR